MSADGALRGAQAGIAAFLARVAGWRADGSDRSIAQRVAGAAFIIRVASAGILYVSQVLLARWMGRFEFGIYVYVWTWVGLLGMAAPFGRRLIRPSGSFPNIAPAATSTACAGF